MAVNEHHVLGLSGGRDSAALAVYMRQNHPELEVDYFFTDTGKELPEVYEFLVKLEGFLGKPIVRLNPDRDFDFWLKQYNNFLPSPQTRWCTRQLKLRPFEQWVRPNLENGDTVYSYVAIRSDEEYREGYSSKHENLIVRLPLKAGGHRQGRSVGHTRWVWLGIASVLRMAHSQRLYLLFFPAEDRMGAADGAAPRLSSKKRRVTRRTPLTTVRRLPGARASRLEESGATGTHSPNKGRASTGEWNGCEAKGQVSIPLRPDAEPIDIDDLYGQAKVCLACHK